MDVWNFVSNELLPSLPTNLYWLKELVCILVILAIILAVFAPFVLLFTIFKKS